MDVERIIDFIGNESLSIVEAMGKIDHNEKGILFIIDKKNKLVGSLTDGDIRRWIMNSGDITNSVKEAMNASPKAITLDDKTDPIEIMKKQSITAIPIVDEENIILDVCLLSEFEEQSKPKGNLRDVPVVIMAGGKGTRLYPYTKILPKPLVPIGDTPIVERIMDYFSDFEIQSFYLTVNYKKGMIRSYFEESNKEYDIKFVEELKPLGTGGSLRLIDEKLDKPIFITNSDTLILADYYDIYNCHKQEMNDITMVSALKKFQVPYGVIHIGEKGILEKIEEKPIFSYFINTGMYIINPDIIELIPNDQLFHMTHLVDAVKDKGGKVGTYPLSEDSFLDMGEFDEMRRMEEKLKVVSD